MSDFANRIVATRRSDFLITQRGLKAASGSRHCAAVFGRPEPV